MSFEVWIYLRRNKYLCMVCDSLIKETSSKTGYSIIKAENDVHDGGFIFFFSKRQSYYYNR